MADQERALRLADALADYTGCTLAQMDQAAAELRRLSAIEDEWARLSQDDGKAERAIARLSAVNAELLEALRVAVDSDLGRLWVWPESAKETWLTNAQAAIAKAEGGQT